MSQQVEKSEKRGRPKKYILPEDLESAKKNHNKKFYESQKEKVKKLEQEIASKDEKIIDLSAKLFNFQITIQKLIQGDSAQPDIPLHHPEVESL